MMVEKVVDTFSKSHELGIISKQPEEAIKSLRSANILSLLIE
jgi:hypothetical protein